MDEEFSYFLNVMGGDFDRIYVPKSSMERYQGRLPEQLLSYWDKHGWCGYADGLFWTVNPHDYEPVVRAWIGDTPFMQHDAYHVIARGAFGDLYLWGEQTGFSLQISAIGAWASPQESPGGSSDEELRFFFGTSRPEDNDFADYFAPALQKLGRLKSDEMYGFVPALALGGPSKFENLQKVKAVEHLVFLAQVSELEVMGSTPPSWIFGS